MWRFKRCRLLLAITALAVLAALLVILASPYAPVVQPVRDIEEIWAIEDARTESETPLLTRLQNNGVALAYDAYENTFYCALGMENGEEWPNIHLTAPGAKDIEICFVDDYAYDWCADAIREGYAYQIIAYNDEAFSYAQIVFTGLPILRVTTREEIPAHVDVPGELTMSCSAEEGMQSHIRTHKRGGSTLFYNNPKIGYKVEFTRNSDGTRKVQMPVYGLGTTDQFILLPCISDMMLDERLCWDLYGMLEEEDAPFGKRSLFYTELFINDEYQGVYLAMKPFDYAEELRRVSNVAPETDALYRTIAIATENPERPQYADEHGPDYEVHYTTGEEGREFAALNGFIDAFKNAYEQTPQSNEAFCDAIVNQMDLDSFIQYFLYLQACGLKDNTLNNMYIWARHTSEGYRYRFLPWDLNSSWDSATTEIEDQSWVLTDIFDRAIELDCGGVIRSRMDAMWKEMRETVFTQENVERLTSQYVYELNESGAFYRDAAKWGTSIFYADNYQICAYAMLRFDVLDKRIEEMTSEALRGRLLEIEDYETIDAGELKSEPAQ